MNLRWINGYFIPRVGHMILDLGYLAGRNHGVCHGKQGKIGARVAWIHIFVILVQLCDLGQVLRPLL